MTLEPRFDDVVVFLGPTLPLDTARSILDARYLSPVSQGDVYSVAKQKPWAVGIVDGYFERVPAAWHKEILWALSQGVHVFGAASLGALRAAELERFGMVGVGRVFEQFHEEILEDDDEVAIVHGPAESGYMPLSTAMVDIRATLARAIEEGLVTPDVGAELIAIAKATFYADRTYPRLLKEAASVPRLREFCKRLEAWLPEHGVQQKRDDAVAMLLRIREQAPGRPPRQPVRFSFSRTSMWEAFCLEGDRYLLDGRPDAENHTPDAALEEYRLERGDVRLARERALGRVLALEAAQLLHLEVDPGTRSTAEQQVIGGPNPESADVQRAWCEAQHVPLEELPKLLEDVALEERIRRLCEPLVEGEMRNLLRLEGRYGDLVRRSLDKQRKLEALGLSNPSLEDVGLDEQGLWRWYFEQRNGTEIPTDWNRFLADSGFESLDHLRAAVIREYAYRRQLEKRSSPFPEQVPNETPDP